MSGCGSILAFWPDCWWSSCCTESSIEQVAAGLCEAEVFGGRWHDARGSRGVSDCRNWVPGGHSAHHFETERERGIRALDDVCRVCRGFCDCHWLRRPAVFRNHSRVSESVG